MFGKTDIGPILLHRSMWIMISMADGFVLRRRHCHSVGKLLRGRERTRNRLLEKYYRPDTERNSRVEFLIYFLDEKLRIASIRCDAFVARRFLRKNLNTISSQKRDDKCSIKINWRNVSQICDYLQSTTLLKFELRDEITS